MPEDRPGRWVAWPADRVKHPFGADVIGSAVCPVCKTPLHLKAASRLWKGIRYLSGFVEVRRGSEPAHEGPEGRAAAASGDLFGVWVKKKACWGTCAEAGFRKRGGDSIQRWQACHRAGIRRR